MRNGKGADGRYPIRNLRLWGSFGSGYYRRYQRYRLWGLKTIYRKGASPLFPITH